MKYVDPSEHDVAGVELVLEENCFMEGGQKVGLYIDGYGDFSMK